MSRKHNVKKTRAKGGYRRRLNRDGLERAPRMRWTGMTTDQIQRAFAAIPPVRKSDNPNYRTQSANPDHSPERSATYAEPST